MSDPVVCVDGFSYERESILHWFREHEPNKNGELIFSSPITGQRLQSALVIPNINLQKAIAHYFHHEPNLSRSKPNIETKQSSSTLESLQFSQWTLGKSVTLSEHRSVVSRGAQPADTADWYDSIAISAFPSRFTADEKPRALF